MDWEPVGREERASMGPLRERSGESYRQGMLRSLELELQWGRCANAAESSGEQLERRLACTGFNGAAARTQRRAVVVPRVKYQGTSLQWGRCANAAESHCRGGGVDRGACASM